MNAQISGTGGAGFGGADHVDIESLLAYAHGEARGAEADAVLRHSRACRECGDELAVMLALAGAEAQAADELRRGAPPVASPLRWIGGVAASFALVALVGVALMSWGRWSDTSAADAARRLATTAPPERFMLEYLFDAFAVSDAGPPVRGGFALVVEGRYEEAVALLSSLYETRPGDNELAASLGIAMYLAGDDGERVASLLLQGQRLGPQDSFGNLAGWYLANLYLRRGDVVQAKGVLEDLSRAPDLPGARAREVLERLRLEIR